MNWIKENWFKLSVTISVFLLLCVIAFSFFYYLVVLPNKKEAYKEAQDKEQAAQQADAQKKADQAKNLNDTLRNICLSGADANYTANWTSMCKKFGIDNKGALCSLPQYNADSVEQWKKDDKADCYKKYPVTN